VSGSKGRLLEFVAEQIKIEKEIVRSLNESLEKIDNPAVKAVLKGISLDSLKHADMYEAVEKLLRRMLPPLDHERLYEQRRLVEKHVEYEARLIEKIEKILPEIDDEKVKFVLNAILADEKRHHRLLKKVLEVLIKAETISPDEWWDLIWRDVPFHGAPGG